MMRIVSTAMLLLVLATTAGLANPKPRVVVLIAGSCSARDFAGMLDEGSAGLLNVRAGRPSRELEPGSKSGFESGCISLGAGAMATGGAEVRLAGDASGLIDAQTVRDAFEYRTGVRPRGAAILHPEIALMARVNAESSYRAKPGELGSALHKAGIRTAVIGCSDIPGEIHREAVAAAMDERGTVDYGEVDGAKLLRPDPSAPYGIRTNPTALLDMFDRLRADCRFVVIDYGDTFRADSYSELCTDQQAAALKAQSDARVRSFARQLERRLDARHDLLIVLSPNARSFSEIEGERMGAIVIRGPGFSGGMLTSPSTRRGGIVTLGDVGPTILDFLGAAPGVEMVGRPMRNVPSAEVARTLLLMNSDASAQAQRQVIMRWSSVAQSVIVVLLLVAILLPGPLWTKRLASWLALSFVAIPVAMLSMPLVCSVGLVGSTLVLIGLTAAIIGLCALVIRSPGRAFVWLCAALVLGLMVDLLRGAPLIQASIAGYNVIEGARYYGIGNELMGTMLGATIAGLGMALASGRIGKRIAGLASVALLGATFVSIGAPFLGANIGGALAAAPAIGVVLLARRGWRPSARGIALIALLTVVLVGGLFATDALRSGAAQSHAGKTVAMMSDEGAGGLLWVIERKLALNCMLIVTSVWSRLLGLCMAGSAALYWWGSRLRGGSLLRREEYAAVLGCLVGTLGAFAFNDSGVVAGATCAVFLFGLLALRLLENDKGRI